MIGPVSSIMKYIGVVIFILMQLSANQAFAARSSNVNLEVGAESVPRLVIYYRDLPIPEQGIDFPLPIDGLSQRFERTSGFFYLIGNVEHAEIVFTDARFELVPRSGFGARMHLSGSFIKQGATYSAQQPLDVPVLRDISNATVATGFKVNFKSEYASGVYSQGRYSNVFNMLVTPKL